MPDWLLFVIGMLLTLGTGVFVAAEFSLVNLDRAQLEARAAKGERGLGTIIGALKHTATHLSSAQLGITITTLLAGYTFEPAISAFLLPLLEAVGLGALGPGVATIVAVAVATVLSMLFGELAPKNFALAEPIITAKVVAPIQVAFTAIFRPAVALLNDTSNLVLHRMGIEPQEELSSARSAEELASLVKRAALAGSLDRQTATLLTKTIDFTELTAADIMTPRPRITALPVTATAADVVAAARSTGYSRFPVYAEDLDDVIGLVHLKQALRVPHAERGTAPVRPMVLEVTRVPETMTLDSLLGALRNRSLQMAVVVDEYGGTAGIATLEDLVEELVGDVADEHDRLRVGVVHLKSGDWLLPGLLRPDELAEQSGVEIPEDGSYDTLAGYVMAHVGRLLQEGDEYTDASGTFTVIRMDGRRADRFRFRPAPPDPVDDAEELLAHRRRATATGRGAREEAVR